MNAPTIMNRALAARNMLPLDGHCTCHQCGRSDLTREEMGTRSYCNACLDDAGNQGSASLEEHYTHGETLTYDYARGAMVRR